MHFAALEVGFKGSSKVNTVHPWLQKQTAASSVSLQIPVARLLLADRLLGAGSPPVYPGSLWQTTQRRLGPVPSQAFHKGIQLEGSIKSTLL